MASNFTIKPITKNEYDSSSSQAPGSSNGGFTITPIGESSGDSFRNYLNNYNSYIKNRQSFANKWNGYVNRSNGKAFNTEAPEFNRYTSTATHQLGRQAQPLWGYAKSHKQEFLDQGYTEEEYNRMLESLGTTDLNQYNAAASYASQFYKSQLKDMGVNPNRQTGVNNFITAMSNVDEALAGADRSVAVNGESKIPPLEEINGLEEAYKAAEQKENEAYQALGYVSDPLYAEQAQKDYQSAKAATNDAKKAWEDAQTAYDSGTTSGSYDVAKQYSDRAAELMKGGEYEEDAQMDDLLRRRDEAYTAGNTELWYELNDQILTLQDEMDTRWNKDLATAQFESAYASAYQWSDYQAAAINDPETAQIGLAKAEEDLNAYLDNATSVFDSNEANKMKHEHPTEEWTDEQKQTFGWMYVNDPKKAAEYATQINNGLDAIKREEEAKSITTDNEGNNKNLGIGDWLKARYYDLGSIGNFILNAYEYLDTGTVTSKNFLSPSERAQIIDSAISQNLNEKSGTLPENWFAIGGKGLGDVYQMGNSILMSTIAGLSTGGGWLGSLSSGAMFFGPAASNAYYQAVDQGATPGQAIMFGLASGTFEMLFEEISLDKVKGLSQYTVNTPSKNLAEGVLKWARAVGVSAFIEGDEEINTSIANWIGEAVILQDKAQSKQKILDLMANEGLSHDEAWLRVFKENCEDIAYDGIVGGISGAVHTGAYSGAESIYNAGTYDNSSLETGTRGVTINEQGIQANEEGNRPAGKFEAKTASDLIDIASRYGDTDLADKTRAAMQKRADKGKGETITRGQARQLAASITPETYMRGKNVDTRVESASKLVDEETRAKGGTKAETKDIAMEIGGKKYTIQDIGYGNKREVRLTDAEGKTESKSIDEVFDQLPEETRTLITWADNVLGKDAARAIYLYDGSQTIAEYVSAMNAATIAASTGKTIEKAGDPLIGTLNDKQIAVAQTIGEEMHKADLADTEKRTAEYEAAKKAADEAIKTADVTAATTEISNLQKSLDMVNEDHAAAVAALNNLEPNTQDYLEAKERVKEINAQRQQIQSEINQKQLDLETLKKKVRFTARKKGTVSYGGGTIEGVKQNAVTGPITKKQQNVVDMVNALADVFNFDYVFFDGDARGTQGAYVGGGKIFININAGGGSKMLAASTLGHELTHAMQDYAKNQYDELRDYIEASYKKKYGAAVWNQRIEATMAAGYSRPEAINEIVANSCSEMLANSKAIQELAQENSSLFEDVRKRIGDIVAKVKAAYGTDVDTGHAEVQLARAFEELQKYWDDAARAMVENKTNLDIAGKENTTGEGGVQYLLAYTKKHEPVAVIEDDILENVPKDQWIKTVANKIKSFRPGIPIAGKLIGITGGSAKEFTSAKDSRYLRKNDQPLLESKYKAANNIDDVIIAATNYVNEAPKHDRNDNIIDFARGKVNMLIGGKAYKADALVGYTDESKLVFRDLANIEKTNEFSEADLRYPATRNNPSGTRAYRSASKQSITEKTPEVKENTQLQRYAQDWEDEHPNLIAVHNKSVNGLKRMLERNGVPFPSIAIKKAGTPHQGFGDVSIVFPRSTIDPQANRQNRLYSNDAWSPTEPHVDYDVGNTYRYVKKLNNLVGNEIFSALRGQSYLEESELARRLSYNNGDIAESIKNITALKYAYLQSIGKTPKIPARTEDLDRFHKYKNEQLMAIFDSMMESEIENLDYDSPLLERVAEILNEQFRSQYAGNAKTFAALLRTPPYRAEKINPNAIKDAYHKYVSNGKSILLENDFDEFDRIMRADTELENSEGYRKWLEDYFKDLIVDSGIYNGKDIYTNSGSRRSFKQLHVPATLENIVAEMKKQQERGVGMAGINLRGAATKTYNTVEEMRSESGKLLGERIDDDVYDSYMSEFHSRLHDMSRQAAKSERWETIDSAEEILLEAIRDSKNEQDMGRRLKKEAQWINYSPELSEELWQLRTDVQNMPAPYFEAKPRRIVSPDEALAYIVPDNADQEVLDALNERGYNVLTYEAGNEQDRFDKLNSLQNAQFQRYQDQDQISLDEWLGQDTIKRSDVHPDIRKRLDDAAALETKVKKYFDNVSTDSEYYLDYDEIDDMMSVDPYGVDGDMYNAEQIVMNLSDLAKEQTGKKQQETFELMEELLPHLSIYEQGNWIEEQFSQNPAFTEWYNNRHPSLYYPGYVPGQMDKKKEAAYLQKMLQRDDLLEQDRINLQNQLDSLIGNWDATFYQRWAEQQDQTSLELADSAVAQNRLKVENAELKNVITDLNKQIKELAAEAKKSGRKIEDLKRQMQKTDKPEVREADARKMARQLIKEYHSNAKVDEITADIKALGDYLVQHTGEELDYSELTRMSEEIADKVVSEAYGILEDVTGEKQIYQEIADVIKNRKFWLPENMRGELDVLDGYNTFRKKNIGRFKLGEGGESIDSFYEEMQDSYGKTYFPDVNTQGEMLIVMSEIFDQAKDDYGNPFAQDQDQIIGELANTILGDAIGENLRQMAPTLADKQQAKIKALQAKNKARMDALRQQKNERIADVYRKGIAMREQAVAKERAAKYEKIDALKQHYAAKEKRAAERRNNSRVRVKIRKLINELNTRLRNPNQKKYVPVEFTQATIDLLNMINLDTGRSESLSAKLGQVRNMYDSYKQNETYAVAYDETMSDMLKELAAKIGDTPLHKMTADQLDSVYNALKSLHYVINNAIKIRHREEEYNAYNLAKEAISDTLSIPKAQKNAFARYIAAHLRADVMFSRLGGFKKNSAWNVLSDILNDGQLKQTRIQMLLSMPFADLINDTKAMQHFTGTTFTGKVNKNDLVDIGLQDENGSTILVSHDMMVGIYMDLLNEQNRRHFISTGKVIPDLQEFYSGKGGYDNGSRAVGISGTVSEKRRELAEAIKNEDSDRAKQIRDEIELTIARGELYADGIKKNIEKQLTAFDKKWIQATQKLMDQDSKRYLNETTMEVYGIEKANVPNYFPITVSKEYLNSPFETITKDMNLENVGFMKERVESGKPTLAMGTFSVVNNQINRVSQYCGLMPAIRSFNKVFNKVEAGQERSVKNAVSRQFGQEGLDWIENLISDFTGSRKEKGNEVTKILGKLRGNLAQSTLTLNLRVALGQVASFPSAAAELGWKPIMKAFAKGGKNHRLISRADKELIGKYSPLLWLRMQGYADVELGDIKNSNNLSSKVWKKLRWATGWIQAFDGATVGRLWSAAEYWVQDNVKGVQVGTDEYYQEVAKKFNDVVEKTQPNYTTMQRATILRDPNTLMKTLTMFMTQRLQNFNVLYNATATYQKMRADYANHRNDVNQRDVQTAKNDMVRAVSSQLAQAVTYVGFKFIADAVLHGLDAYRDKDDDELTAQSISLQLLNNYVDTLIGSVIAGGFIYSVIKTIAGRDKWYGLSVNGIDSLNDFINDFISMAGAWRDLDREDEKSVQKMHAAELKLGKSLATVLGLPLNNAIKIVNGMINHAKDIANHEFLSFNAGFEVDKDAVGIRMVNALKAGDTEKFDSYADTYGSTSSMYSAVEKQVKDGYQAKKQTITKQEAIDLLVEAGEPKRTAEKKVQQWTCKLATGIDYDKIDDQFVADKISEDRAAELYVTYGGMTKADAKSYVQQIKCEKVTGIKYSDIKSEYIAGNLTDAKAKSMLKTYGGKSEDAANKTVLKYAFEKDTEYSWDDKAEALYAGAVSDSKLAGYIQKISPTTYGTKEKADNYVKYLHFQHDYPRYADLSESNVKAIYEAKDASGLSMQQAIDYQIKLSACKGTDKDGDGKTDTNSLRDAKIRMILALPYDYETKLKLFKLSYTSKAALEAFKKAAGK